MTKYEDALHLVRYELNKVILKDLAEAIDLTYSCLGSIREGRTQWPRKKTLEKLLPELGLRLEICYAKS